MKTQELKDYINKTLGNSIRCLLPAYWWKRLFGLVIDRVDEVEQDVRKAITKEVTAIQKEVAAAKVPIVQTEEELANLNVETGSIATVQKGSGKKFSECVFIPQNEIVNFEKLSRITGVGVKDTTELSVPDDFSSITMWLYDKELAYGGFLALTKEGEFIEVEARIEKDDGMWWKYLLTSKGVVDEAQVRWLNNALADTDVRYAGRESSNLTPEQFAIVDSILSWGVSAEAFIKDEYSWDKLVKDKDNEKAYIVPSEEGLNSLNVPDGTIAQVAYDITSDFADLYLPTLSEVDTPEALSTNFSKLGRVSGIKIIKTLPLKTHLNLFLTSGVSFDEFMVFLGGYDPIPKAGVTVHPNKDDDLLFAFCDKSGLIIQSNIDKFNEILSKNDYRLSYYVSAGYGGNSAIPIDEIHNYIVIDEGTFTDAYIKSDTWEKFAKEDIIKQYVDNTVSNVSIDIDTAMSGTSTNAVQNKVVKEYVDTAISQSITNTLNTAV